MADSNILRIGKISSINYPEGTARISYEDKDGSTTSELPFLAWEYWMPKIGAAAAGTELAGPYS